MVEELKKLTRQRGSCRGQLTRLYNSMLTATDLNTQTIDYRIEKLEDIIKGFSDIQFQIESLEDNDENETIRAKVEETYYKCKDYMISCRQKLEVAATDRTAANNISPSPSIVNVKSILPKIQIKPFDGSYVEWNSFFDMFKGLVHENESLPTVHKFHLLKSYLRGDAATVIAALNATEDNYSVAWNLLQKRFDNPRKTVQAHVRALFELPEVSRGCPSALRVLADRVEMHINALRSLDQTIGCHEMFIYVVTSKIDKITRIHWERTIEDGVLPTVQDLIKFLNKFACDVEPVNLANTRAPNVPREKFQNMRHTDRSQQTYVSVKQSLNCPVCQQKHFIQACDQFLKLDTRSRIREVKKAKLCLNCLRPDHPTAQCWSSSCRQCHKKHNNLLHLEISNSEQTNIPREEQPSSNAVTMLAYEESEILLSTARIIILDDNNKEQQCRVLLDPGSQSNFITEGLAKTLRLRLHPINMPVSGLGESSNKIKHYTKATIKCRCSKFEETTTFLTIPTITGRLPARQVDRAKVSIPSNIKLADPEFYKPAPIDALLGEYLFYKLLCVGQIRLVNSKSVLQKTRLGWVVSGEIGCDQPIQRKTSCHLANQDVNAQMTKFWEIEECPTQKHLSKEDRESEKHYQTHTTRDDQGRYTVRIPFKTNAGRLGDSHKLALKRFYSLENKLHKQEELHKQYSDFIREYLALRHMSLIANDTNREGLYLPHHAVLKATSTTTKLRVVFDASAKTKSGISLNDILLVGPTIQDDLFQLVIRFRLHNYVLTADIEKMFRQINMHPEDRKFQKILWRYNNNEPIKTYNLNTVTYGTASASFLAVRTLKQLARDEGKNFHLAAAALENDFYVDDLLTGAPTMSQATRLRDELIQLLKLGGFNLRQWASNEQTLVGEHSDKAATDAIYLNVSDTKKTLGICWNAKLDCIEYYVERDTKIQRVTKREILSKIARLFDPLGLLAPILITAKILMQELWKAQLDWDESVPQSIHTVWANYMEQLNKFQ
ncbi:uncharacterized protein LOC117228236 [Megalopta genalis]|uniref:uncharacterized protein LOC117228236 n=1 Tax=Megalopta genalis TaxID=115081 RepID=UPI003FCF2D1E